MLTIIAWVVGILVVLGAALYLTVRHNGPAVLDTADRIIGPANGTALVERASYSSDPAQKLRVYRDGAANRKLPVLVFVHGGSWAWGNPDDYGFIARAFAPQGYLVVLAGYRLGEAGRYPAMLEDTASAVRWARDHAAKLGGDPDRILLAGHSAGAYNVVAIALEQRWLEAAGVPDSAIRGVVGLSGPYDFFPFTTDSAKATFASVGAGAESQPVNHARGDGPPLLLVHGEADTLVKPRNSRALARAVLEKGGQVETLFLPGRNHNDPLIGLTRYSHDAGEFAAVSQFLARQAQVSVSVQGETP